MSGIILCDDILEIVGKEVKEIREEDTRDFYIGLWNTSERLRGWWCLADTEMNREFSATPTKNDSKQNIRFSIC